MNIDQWISDHPRAWRRLGISLLFMNVLCANFGFSFGHLTGGALNTLAAGWLFWVLYVDRSPS